MYDIHSSLYCYFTQLVNFFFFPCVLYMVPVNIPFVSYTRAMLPFSPIPYSYVLFPPYPASPKPVGVPASVPVRDNLRRLVDLLLFLMINKYLHTYILDIRRGWATSQLNQTMIFFISRHHMSIDEPSGKDRPEGAM